MKILRRVIMSSLHTQPHHREMNHPSSISLLQWVQIRADLREFNPELTLLPGQSFNWKRLANDNYWVGVVEGYPLIISKEATGSKVASLDASLSKSELNTLMDKYLQLEIKLRDLYAMVSDICAILIDTTDLWVAVGRLLSPHETRVSFLSRNSSSQSRSLGMLNIFYFFLQQ